MAFAALENSLPVSRDYKPLKPSFEFPRKTSDNETASTLCEKKGRRDMEKKTQHLPEIH